MNEPRSHEGGQVCRHDGRVKHTEEVARNYCDSMGAEFKGMTETPDGVWWNDARHSTGFTYWRAIERAACESCYGDGKDGEGPCGVCEGTGFPPPAAVDEPGTPEAED